jgi:hypothetical protein
MYGNPAAEGGFEPVKNIIYMVVAMALALPAADRKPLPGQAGNDDIDLSGSVMVDREEIKQAVGVDLGGGYVVVRMKASPKTAQPLRIGPDDFTIISRKDGQRSQALLPGEIAGTGGTLVVRSASQGGGAGSESRRTLGIGGMGGIGMGNSRGVDTLDAKVQAGDSKASESPLLAALKEKGLADKETKESLEGLLYFPIEGKIKPKDLAIVYKGPAGKLVMEFQNAKGGR